MLHILTNILAFAFALGVIIFVHESGHLLVAKAFGIRVLTFSLGFGRRLWGFRRGETDYRVSLIPLGGYVKLGGENPEESTGDPREFLSHPRWQRVIVYLAGPAMNVVLAVVLIAAVFMIGIEVPDLQDIPPVLGTVEAGSPAAAAGLKPGDRIAAVNGKAVSRWQEVGFALMTSPGRPVALDVRREDSLFHAEVVSRAATRDGIGDTAGMYPVVLPRILQVLPGGAAEAAGFLVGDELRAVDGKPITDPRDFVSTIEAHARMEVRIEINRGGQILDLAVVPKDQDGKGKIGVAVGVFQRYGPLRAIVESVRYNWGIAQQTLVVLGKIVSHQIPAKSALSGPIEIAALSGAAARSGFHNLLYLMGFISISIAILNLLPLPILDGGQIAILLIESVRRRDLSLRLKEKIAQAGFVLLVALMLIVLYFDLVKALPFGGKPGP